MKSIHRQHTNRKPGLLRFLLTVCAFILAAAIHNSQCYAGLFTSNIKDYVNQKGFTWKSDDTPNFRFYFEPGTFGEKHRDKLKDDAEQSRKRLLTLLGQQQFKDRITIFVLDSRARMNALIGREVNGISFPDRNAVLYVFSDSINASGSHELCHVLAKNLWGKTDWWINEGLAVYSDDRWHQYRLHDLAKHLLLKNRLISLEEVIMHHDRYSELITYPEMGSFVKFLYEKFGMNKVREIWKKGASAIPRITGKNLDELEKEWHDVIGQADDGNIMYVERYKL
jgi:hypothetical protein